MAFQIALPSLFLFGLSIFFSAVHAENVAIDFGDGGAKSAADNDGEIVDLYDPVLRLNRFSFHKNVLQETADEIPHWIVLFCPPWFEPCQSLEPIYRQLATKWQDRLNGGMLSQEVRFAGVDCAAEKALCNTQAVGMNYPFIAHYRKHEMVSAWRGKSLAADEKRLISYLQKQLGAMTSTPVADGTSEHTVAEEGHSIPMDFLLIFAAIAGNAWFMSRGFSGDESPCEISKPSAHKAWRLEGFGFSFFRRSQ